MRSSGEGASSPFRPPPLFYYIDLCTYCNCRFYRKVTDWTKGVPAVRMAGVEPHESGSIIFSSIYIFINPNMLSYNEITPKKYIDLEGDIGVLANGAGLTMTTMDVVRHHGGRPANFLEIGGESYTQAKPALELLLSNPRIKSLVINFCGAFARTDVMTQGVIEAIEALQPQLPSWLERARGRGAEF